MAPNIQPPSSSPQVSDLGLADLYHQLRTLDAERRRLRDEIERVKSAQEILFNLDGRHSAEVEVLAWNVMDSGIHAQINHIRKIVNELSRPFLRLLHILDLPDEVLVNIFGAVRCWIPPSGGHNPFPNRSGTQDIKHARLTCRRFCRTSSEFLLNSISVEASPESLAKLGQISSHPTIGRGVEAIHINLGVYDNLLAIDLDRFVEYHRNRLLGYISTLRDPLREQDKSPEQTARLYANDKIRRITQAWRAFAQKPANYRPTEEDSRCQQLLERGFEENHRRYAEQQDLLDSGAFVANIASALKVMPAARHLRINDSDDDLPIHSSKDSRIGLDAQLLDDQVLCKALSKRQPMSYGAHNHHALASNAIPVIPALLAALDGANIYLVSLRIELSMNRDFFGLGLRTGFGVKIRSAMANLKTFDFIHRGPIYFHGLYELGVLQEFLAAIISTEDLQCLCVKLNVWDSESALDPATIPPVSIVKARTAWSNLSSVTLDTLHIENSDLTHLLNCAESSKSFVGLHKVHLTDGSWASILDKLKDRHSWANLTSPSGAECEMMSIEEYERVFGPYAGTRNPDHGEDAYHGATEAHAYIRGWGADNPLKTPAELYPD